MNRRTVHPAQVDPASNLLILDPGGRNLCRTIGLNWVRRSRCEQDRVHRVRGSACDAGAGTDSHPRQCLHRIFVFGGRCGTALATLFSPIAEYEPKRLGRIARREVSALDWHCRGPQRPLRSENLQACSIDRCSSLKVNVKTYTFLVGPRVSVSVRKFTPFAHFLVGAGHANNSGSGYSDSDTSIATAIGGGLDYKLIPAVAWRLQGDELHTRFFGATQDHLRLSTGLVIRF